MHTLYISLNLTVFRSRLCNFRYDLWFSLRAFLTWFYVLFLFYFRVHVCMADLSAAHGRLGILVVGETCCAKWQSAQPPKAGENYLTGTGIQQVRDFLSP